MPEIRPVCFIAMPFRRKRTDLTGDDIPAEVDFDALWDKAYRPAIEEAGYVAIRADLDTGSVIVKDMVERLAYADLVLADVSLPNGNVYYEIGLRHVAKEKGCILFAADWSRQLFDIAQFTSVRYALRNGNVTDNDAIVIRQIVVDAIAGMKESRTPWHEFIVDAEPDQRTVFYKEALKLSAFQADMRAIRLERNKDKQTALVRDRWQDLSGSSALTIPTVAIGLLEAVRDNLGWQDVITFVDALEESVRTLPYFVEQRALATSKTGNHTEAIASLESLNAQFGETEERLGQIGGRYKRLWSEERDARINRGESEQGWDEEGYLDQAIDHYQRGMNLDLNEYYCSGNLANLCTARGSDGDAARALLADQFVVAACERKIARRQDDGWTRQTLLGAAFRGRNVLKAKELVGQIRRENVAAWNLHTTLKDIDTALALMEDAPEKAELTTLRDRLVALSAHSAAD